MAKATDGCLFTIRFWKDLDKHCFFTQGCIGAKATDGLSFAINIWEDIADTAFLAVLQVLDQASQEDFS